MTKNENTITVSNPLNQKETTGQTYRFRLMQGVVTKEGKFERSKTVGMSYLKNGQSLYTLRLWTLLESRFYLIPSKSSYSRYLVMTREPTRNGQSKNKYYWNIVGNGQVEVMAGVLRIQFDLFDRPVYMNLFPEAMSQSGKLSGPDVPEFVPECVPETFDDAA